MGDLVSYSGFTPPKPVRLSPDKGSQKMCVRLFGIDCISVFSVVSSKVEFLNLRWFNAVFHGLRKVYVIGRVAYSSHERLSVSTMLMIFPMLPKK